MKIHHTEILDKKADLTVLVAFSAAKNNSKESPRLLTNLEKTLQKKITSSPWYKTFKAEKGEHIVLDIENRSFLLLGLGAEKNFSTELFRRTLAAICKSLKHKNINQIIFDLEEVLKNVCDNSSITLQAALEAMLLSQYDFLKYKSTPPAKKIEQSFSIYTKTIKNSSFQKIYQETFSVCQSINLIRDWINEAPNTLHAEHYADLVKKDAKDLEQVQIKILTKKQIQQEKMNLFLSVNAGSHFEPRLVHLTYTPKKITKDTKHIVLVGKGITFDTGGYSLKPSASMMGMKFDMGGSATVYGTLRAAALNESPNKITCLMVLTDNAVGPQATVPDAIVTARNGKTVEILNTDAEGRLILADALDYACDLKPDTVIDVATLTGACLVSLGKEVCGLMGNSEKLISDLKSAAKKTDEYIWQLPIIQEYRDDIKSKVADIKNIGSAGRAGTSIGAVFLENFIQEGIEWAHLDIAGVCDDQNHLPYCPAHGASGLMVRTLYNYVMQ